jgi:hypothetical protein
MQLLQQEIISQYIQDIPVCRSPKKKQSKWAAMIKLANTYTEEQIQQLEYDYYNSSRFISDLS